MFHLPSIVRLEKRINHFSLCHPVFAFLLAFAAMPVFILLAVSLGTSIFALPFALIFGWL